MKTITESKKGINTIMALSLIPLSGLAMDVFVPSLPDMAEKLDSSPSAIQLTLSLFIISYGISQLIVGGLIDSYGRYLPNLASLLVFSAASFVIAFSEDINTIYFMRIVQGFTVAVIAVSKRSFFMDMYSGEQLKKYTSLFSVIWAIAPIVAPFLGAFFQTRWGWSSNFIFLGCFGLLFFVIELVMGGESMKLAQPFNARVVLASYRKMIRTADFTAGIFILGLIYAMVLLYGMASPFLIEHRLHYSPIITGYSSLFSGVSILIGGFISRMLIQRPFLKKLLIAGGLQLAALVILIPLTWHYQNLFTLMLYVFVVHSLAGFIFNNLMSYCLTRFPQYAGKASGLAGGGFSVACSIFSSFLVNAITITSQAMLGIAYLLLAIGVLFLLLKTRWKIVEGKEIGEKPALKQTAA